MIISPRCATLTTSSLKPAATRRSICQTISGLPPTSSKGFGVASDASGSIYFSVGNGPIDADQGGHNFGESVLRLSPTLAVQDFFVAVRRLASEARVRLIDLTEWDPPLDATDLSALTAARWVAECLAGFELR